MKIDGKDFLRLNCIDENIQVHGNESGGYKIYSVKNLLDKFAEIKLKEFENNEPRFVVEVKNIDCDFEFLKEGLEQIREEFLVDKDTFIFRNANEELYNRLQKFKAFMEKAGHNIVITKN